MTEAAIVVNRRAGAGSAAVDTLSRRLAERLGARGMRARSIGFDAGDGERWRRELQAACGDGAGRVYVLGGDGTVLAVAGELIGRPQALGIIPLGTANLLARDLGIPLVPRAAVDALTDAERTALQRIDVGRVNGEPFLCASMIGITTALAHTREAERGRAALQLWSRLARKALWLLRRYPYRRITLALDGETQSLKTRALVITNNPVDPAVPLYPRRARLDTGRLGVYGVREGPLWELPRVALRLLNGTWAEDPRVFHYEATALTIETHVGHRVSVLNDGERRLIRTPLRYDPLPAGLRVLAPAARARRGGTAAAPGGTVPMAP